MKISEMIRQLEVARAAHGDILVFVLDTNALENEEIKDAVPYFSIAEDKHGNALSLCLVDKEMYDAFVGKDGCEISH